MKRFLLKVLIFTLVVSVIVLSVNFTYIKMDNSNPDNVKKFDSIPTKIKICNFGSSHGMCGFNYDNIKKIECFNFALSSQSLSYDKRLFEYYNGNIAEGAIVFIPVSYFSLFGEDECTINGFEEKNKRYYRILPSKMIKEYDIKTNIYVNYFPSLYAGVNLFKALLGKSEDKNDEIWSEAASDINVAEEAEKAYKIHIIKNKLDENGNRILNQEELEALKYLIKSCQNMGFAPILITTPFLQEYTDQIKKSDKYFYGEFYNLIDKIVDETGVVYYDYAFDERFINNYDWFMDSDHLNKEGARQFVNILLEEVIHYGDEKSIFK